MAVNNCDTTCVAFDVNGSYSTQVSDQRVRVRNAVNIFRMSTTDTILYKLVLQIQCSLTQVGTALIDLDNRLGGQSVMDIIEDLKLQIATNRNNIATNTTSIEQANSRIDANSGLINTALDELSRQQTTIGGLNQQVIDLGSAIGYNLELTEATYSSDKLYSQVVYYRVQSGTIYITGTFTTGTDTTLKSMLLELANIPAEYAPMLGDQGVDIISGNITPTSGKAVQYFTNVYIQGGDGANAGKIMASLESATDIPASQSFAFEIMYNFVP